MLRNEFDWYLANQNSLVERYSGKHLVIKDNKVVSAFDTAMDALTNAKKMYQPGTFLIQLCTPGEDAYTAKFCSPRMAFA